MQTWVLAVAVAVGVAALPVYWRRITVERERRRSEPSCPHCGGVHPPLNELKGEPEVVSLRRARCRLRARVEELEGEVRDLRTALAAAQRDGRAARPR